MNDELNVIAGIAGKVFNCFTEWFWRGPKEGERRSCKAVFTQLLLAWVSPRPTGISCIAHSHFQKKTEQELKKQNKINKNPPPGACVLGDKSHKTSSQQWVVKKRWRFLIDQWVKPEIGTASMKTTVQQTETRDPPTSNSKATVGFL